MLPDGDAVSLPDMLANEGDPVRERHNSATQASVAHRQADDWHTCRLQTLEMLQLTKPSCVFLQRTYPPIVKAIGADIPLAVVLPIGELVPKEALVRLAVILPPGELLPYPKPAGSVRRPGMWPLEVMLPEDGEPLAVMLPLKGSCKPGNFKVQTCKYFCTC